MEVLYAKIDAGEDGKFFAIGDNKEQLAVYEIISKGVNESLPATFPACLAWARFVGSRSTNPVKRSLDTVVKLHGQIPPLPAVDMDVSKNLRRAVLVRWTAPYERQGIEGENAKKLASRPLTARYAMGDALWESSGLADAWNVLTG